MDKDRLDNAPAGDTHFTPQWALLSSARTLGPWLVRRDAAGVTVFAAPGIAIAESWDSNDLFHWRTAEWHEPQRFAHGDVPDRVRLLAGLADALRLVPADALPQRDVHLLMIGATEAHADALERLAILQEAQPEAGVSDAVETLRNVVRRHREQAARCSTQPVGLIEIDRSPKELAGVVTKHPESVVARVERELKRQRHLTLFVTALEELELEVGRDRLREALIGLVYAKQHSHSWQATRPARVALRTFRRCLRRAMRSIGLDPRTDHTRAAAVPEASTRSASRDERVYSRRS